MAFLRIAETADVVVTNLRPAPLGRLRLSYQDVATVRPDIIFCQAHGYPSDSPQANAPAYDDIVQSASGIGDLFRRQGHEPSLLPTLVADKVAGLMVANAVLTALFHRSRTGQGQRIEVPMVDVMVAMPGASAAEVENRVTRPMEKLLWEIPGVEYSSKEYKYIRCSFVFQLIL